MQSFSDEVVFNPQAYTKDNRYSKFNMNNSENVYLSFHKTAMPHIVRTPWKHPQIMLFLKNFKQEPQANTGAKYWDSYENI